MADENEAAERERYVEAVREGLRAADAGRVVSYGSIRHWLFSWGKGDGVKIDSSE